MNKIQKHCIFNYTPVFLKKNIIYFLSLSKRFVFLLKQKRDTPHLVLYFINMIDFQVCSLFLIIGVVVVVVFFVIFACSTDHNLMN
jgi:vesicle coat complex subunit